MFKALFLPTSNTLVPAAAVVTATVPSTEHRPCTRVHRLALCPGMLGVWGSEPLDTGIGEPAAVYRLLLHILPVCSWDFQLGEQLGGGHFSVVHVATHRMSGRRYALKCSKQPIVSVPERNEWLAVRERA
jgi:serine/threonine protein kinase